MKRFKEGVEKWRQQIAERMKAGKKDSPRRPEHRHEEAKRPAPRRGAPAAPSREEQIKRFREGVEKWRKQMAERQKAGKKGPTPSRRGEPRREEAKRPAPRRGAPAAPSREEQMKRFREGVEKWRKQMAERQKAGKKGPTPSRRPEPRREETRRPAPRSGGGDAERKARDLGELERRLHERGRELEELAKRLKQREAELRRLAEQLKERREGRSRRERD